MSEVVMMEVEANPVAKTTTLAKIREFGPCSDGWGKLLKTLGKTEADDEPLLMSTILESNGLDDALWCLRAFHGEHRQAVIDFACDCAERSLSTWEEWAEKNAPEHKDAPRNAIEVARSGDRSAAARAARAAAAAAADAAYAAYAAARAADAAAAAAAYAAYAAARAAARAADAAADAADAAADAARAAYAAYAAAAAAAYAAARAADAAADAAAYAAAYAAADAAAYAADAAYAAYAAAERTEQEKLLIKHFG